MNNSWPAHIINLITLQLVRISFSPYKEKKESQDPPVLVTGIFRSGTSLTTNLLSHAGFDPGPQEHLLQPYGKYREFNPDGYFENYFFMDLSRYFFHLTDSYGDRPPEEDKVREIDLSKLKDDDFRKYTLLEIHDDRVKNLNKLRVLRKASIHHTAAYLSNAFGAKPVIKNPHFSLLEPLFGQLFPDSLRVVVFRDPAHWQRSAKAVTSSNTIELFDRYYDTYLKNENKRIIFFDYDQLLAQPEHSIRVLLSAIGGRMEKLQNCILLVRKKENAVSPEPVHSRNYSQLKARAINR